MSASRYRAYELRLVAEADTFPALAGQLLSEPEGGDELDYPLAIRDTAVGATYWLADEASLTALDRTGPTVRVPEVGERWLHRTLGEVEVADAFPSGDFMVRTEPNERHSLCQRVEARDLIGRAQ